MARPNHKDIMALAALMLATGAGAPTPAVIAGQTALFAPASAPGSVLAPLIPGARFTAMDLLRRAFPDLDNDGHYRQLLPVKVVRGATMPEIGAGYSQSPGEPALTMKSPSYAVVRDRGHAIAFVLGSSVLVADWLLPVPAVGEAMFVQTDPGAEPRIDRAFPVRQGVAAALVANAREGQASYALYMQGFDGLRAVYDGLTIHTVARTTPTCARELDRQELTDARPLASRHGGYADVALTVSRAITCNGAATPTRPVQRFRMVLTWDARTKRYSGRSPALDRLNRSN